MVAWFVMWNVTLPCGTDGPLFEIEKLRRPMVTDDAAVAIDASATHVPAARTSVASVAAAMRRIEGHTRPAPRRNVSRLTRSVSHRIDDLVDHADGERVVGVLGHTCLLPAPLVLGRRGVEPDAARELGDVTELGDLHRVAAAVLDAAWPTGVTVGAMQLARAVTVSEPELEEDAGQLLARIGQA